jgi:hypothetical protein
LIEDAGQRCGRFGEKKSVISSMTRSGVAVVTKSNSNLVRTGQNVSAVSAQRGKLAA